MFYSLKEVAGKLNKTEVEIRELVKQGRLREFRDGQNLLFKIDEVEAMLCDTTFMASLGGPGKAGKESDEEEILLVTEPGESSASKAEPAEEGTTLAGEGVNVLGETQSDYKLADDTLGETKAVSDEASLEKIEEDVSLDSFGSGSGLLDLSLQADDTSLGGILDEIYTPEGGRQGAAEAGSAVEVAAEAEQIVTEELAEAPSVSEPVVVVGEYVEPAPDASGGLFGAMLFVGILVTIYTAIVAVASINGVRPAILEKVQGLIWYVVIGAAVVEILLFGMTFMVGGGGTKAKKAPKVKKEKKAKKEKKSKKAKKEEEQKEELPKEEALQEPAEPEDKTA